MNKFLPILEYRVYRANYINISLNLSQSTIELTYEQSRENTSIPLPPEEFRDLSLQHVQLINNDVVFSTRENHCVKGSYSNLTELANVETFGELITNQKLGLINNINCIIIRNQLHRSLNLPELFYTQGLFSAREIQFN